MLKHLLVLPDGTQISSGSNGAAVVGVRLTRSVNEGQQLQAGSACAAMLEATLIEVDPGRIAAGDALTLYTVDEHGVQRQEGVFLAEKPERTGKHTLKLTAYDRLTLLDRDMTGWLKGLTEWPYTLHTFAQMVCDACGLTLVTEALPNGDFPVEKFTADGLSGRQLMMWIGEASCRFCRATATGAVELGWYTPVSVALGPSQIPMAKVSYAEGALSLRAQDAQVTDAVSVASGYVTVTDNGAGNLTWTLSDCLQQQYCVQGGLSLADYTVAPIEKVQLRQEEGDVGTLWPDDTAQLLNTYTVTGNPLLTARTAQTLQPVAQNLYQQLKDVTYTPGILKLPAGQPVEPGSILQVTDLAGNTAPFYVMTAERSGQLDILTCVGTAIRDSTGAFNNLIDTPLSGKVLRLQADVDGFKVENADTAGKLAQLSVNVDGVTAWVQHQQETVAGMQEKLTALELTADGITARVEESIETATGAQEKVSELEQTAEGITAQLEETTQTADGLQTQMSTLAQTADGIASQVSAQQKTTEGLQQQMSALEQTADGITATVRSITENGASRVQNEFGLKIDGSCVQICRSGSDMENRLDEQGMYVVRSPGTDYETTMLRADADGVVATDVTVRNYLVVGDHARFEDYTDGADSKRTACFFIGG